jgi:2-polyprenyl-3-methyl-5-hydroxy-6-metoxy-1,4-benzoquinol methylase
MNLKLPEIQYDFRETANPEDEFRPLWEKWVEYYRTKAAISKWLNPKSILEIGVRYGYSAKAFLAGAPMANYTGIDANNGKSGGCSDGFTWARRILPPTSTLLEEDTGKLQSLPGGVYDLIHVDGEQTGLSTYRDLELASKQGRCILCDGYFWTSENFHAVNDFLLRYKDVIDRSLILPGYAGEILIWINQVYLQSHALGARGDLPSSEHLQSFYSADYFLHDCGGFDSFAQHKGLIVSDERLSALLDLVFAREPGRVLDLGCGRGEISIQAAIAGSSVTAIDYSKSAIAIGKEAFAEMPHPCESVDWICESVTKVSLQGNYDTVVCSDVIEHLTPKEVDALYELVANHLSDDGWFIIHTFPNRWFYDYHYKQRQAIARSVGAHLPFEPRSRYEKLMHINEQRPQEMRRQLLKHFPHVCFWFGSPDNPSGSLARKYRAKELAATRDLFAVVSKKPVDRALVLSALLPSQPLSQSEAAKLVIKIIDCPVHLERNATGFVTVAVENRCHRKISSRPPFPLHLSYHWLSEDHESVEIFDGLRTPLGTIFDRQKVQVEMKIRAPSRPGNFILQVRLVQENVRWHEGQGFEDCAQDYKIQIVESLDHPTLRPNQ